MQRETLNFLMEKRQLALEQFNLYQPSLLDEFNCSELVIDSIKSTSSAVTIRFLVPEAEKPYEFESWFEGNTFICNSLTIYSENDYANE